MVNLEEQESHAKPASCLARCVCLMLQLVPVSKKQQHVQVRCCSSLVSGQHCIVLHCNAAAVPRPAVTDDPDGVSCGHCSLLHPHNAHTLLSGEHSAVRRLQECIAQTAEKNVGEVEECNSTVQLIGKCTS